MESQLNYHHKTNKNTTQRVESSCVEFIRFYLIRCRNVAQQFSASIKKLLVKTLKTNGTPVNVETKPHVSFIGRLFNSGVKFLFAFHAAVYKLKVNANYLVPREFIFMRCLLYCDCNRRRKRTKCSCDRIDSFEIAFTLMPLNYNQQVLRINYLKSELRWAHRYLFEAIMCTGP